MLVSLEILRTTAVERENDFVSKPERVTRVIRYGPSRCQDFGKRKSIEGIMLDMLPSYPLTYRDHLSLRSSFDAGPHIEKRELLSFIINAVQS